MTMKNIPFKMKHTVALLSTIALAVLTLISAPSHTAPSVLGDDTITVVVKTASGGKASGVRVNYEVCGTLSCSGQGNGWHTGSDGMAVMTIRSGCKVCVSYVDGKAHKDSYSFGNTYTFTN